MIEVLEKSLHQLRLAQNEKHLRLQSLEMLEDIAHWKLLHCYGEAMDELYRHQLEKAGFDTKASFILSREQLRRGILRMRISWSVMRMNLRTELASLVLMTILILGLS